MVVFLVVLCLARCRTSVRMAIQAAVIAHAFGHQRWDISLFVAGMLIAELDVFIAISLSRTSFMQRIGIKVLLYVIMLIGLWLSGLPREHGTESFGYAFLQDLWPHGDYRRRFWLSIASIFIVGPMPYLPQVQAFFCTKVIRYFGKISFALYLIHGISNYTIGTTLLHFTWKFLGKDGYWDYALSFVVSSLLYTPVVIWWSDM